MVHVTVFSDEEKVILDEYLNQKISVRDIEKMHKGYGRTKIKNIIDKYALFNEETAKEVLSIRMSQKYHKEVTAEEAERPELTDKEIQKAYYEIMQGEKTLTTLAAELNRNRDTLKGAIEDFLGDKESILEFRDTLRQNQKVSKDKQLFFSLSPEEKKNVIFLRLNYRRQLVGKKEYSTDLLEKKFTRIMGYFQDRNDKFDDEEAKLSEDNLLKMMYDYPTILGMSISSKIRPTMKLLDYKFLNFRDASKILRDNPAILGTSMERTSLQMHILQDSNTMKYALEKPRTFRTSPEFMYAQIKAWEEKGLSKTPFITVKKMETLYKMSPDELEAKYDVKDEYGDDEYFDGR